MILKAFRHVANAGRQRRAGMLFSSASECDSFAEVKGEVEGSRWNPEPQTVSIRFSLLLSLLFLLYRQCKWPNELFPRRKCENC